MLKQAEAETRDRFAVEARLIYWALFRGEIPEMLAGRYEQAARELDRSADPRALATVQRLIDQRADLEAAELAGRLTGRLPLLTRKFAAMTFLAETLPDHQRYFVNRRSNRVAGFAELGWAGMLTAVKLTRGLWLLRSVRRG
jgi:hypothetical protein